MKPSYAIPVLLAAALLAVGCAVPGPTRDPDALPRVVERFISSFDPADQIDSVAAWRAPDGKVRLYASAKEGGRVLELDGSDGRLLRTLVAPEGGALLRPNGVFVIDELLFVVERDRRRVLAWRLPALEPVGSFGAGLLRFPYGLWVQRLEAGRYAVYVTDSFQLDDDRDPDASVFRQRVRRFELVDHGQLRLVASASFGAEEAPGALHWVESIFGDPAHDRLLVAEEKLEHGSGVAVYRLDGRFTGHKVSRPLFASQAEGIALRACADGSGQWILSDQHPVHQRYHVLDRTSLAHLGSFTAATARMTDGLWFQPAPAPGFDHGVLYAQHDDQAVVAIDWVDIATALGLAVDCP